jgi:glycine/D-amino acid oxidase-like deaminating enzyme
MHADFLVIGQGICGTFLSWYLHKAGYSFIVADEWQPNSASHVAAGIINPVTGRRMVQTWLIDDVMPFAHNAYQELKNELNVATIEQKNSVDFFPTPQMKLSFNKRFEENNQYLSLPADEAQWQQYFNYDFGFGVIDPCYLVNVQSILPAYRNWLSSRQLLWEEKVDTTQLQVTESNIRYKDITASAVIFCDGIASFNNLWFANLPFAPNKGEVLWIEAPGIPATHIFKRGINLAPWNEQTFWVGSSYEWEFEHDQPTELFRERTMAIIKHWLKAPVKLMDHKAAIRPATIERRPFIGFHPHHPSVAIFNGMGTKGCSLAPWFANQFVNHIRDKTPLHAEVDVKRFQRVLGRNLK